LASPENIFQSWMDSPGHRENILDSDYREVGIGTATGVCEGYSDCTMYTADFGARQSSAPKEGADIPQGTNTPQERADTPQRDDATQDSNATGLNLYQYILRLL
jgi:hypothetical protein